MNLNDNLDRILLEGEDSQIVAWHNFIRNIPSSYGELIVQIKWNEPTVEFGTMTWKEFYAHGPLNDRFLAYLRSTLDYWQSKARITFELVKLVNIDSVQDPAERSFLKSNQDW